MKSAAATALLNYPSDEHLGEKFRHDALTCDKQNYNLYLKKLIGLANLTEVKTDVFIKY